MLLFLFLFCWLVSSFLPERVCVCVGRGLGVDGGGLRLDGGFFLA